MCIPSRSPRPRTVPNRRIAREVCLYRLHRRMSLVWLSLAWCLAKADHARVVRHPSVHDRQLKGLHPSALAIARVESSLRSVVGQALVEASDMLHAQHTAQSSIICCGVLGIVDGACGPLLQLILFVCRRRSRLACSISSAWCSAGFYTACPVVPGSVWAGG